MTRTVTCSWCHSAAAVWPGVPTYCPTCRHRADLCRLDCDCPTCRRGESPTRSRDEEDRTDDR